MSSKLGSFFQSSPILGRSSFIIDLMVVQSALTKLPSVALEVEAEAGATVEVAAVMAVVAEATMPAEEVAIVEAEVDMVRKLDITLVPADATRGRGL